MCGSIYREVECSPHTHTNTSSCSTVVSAVLFKIHCSLHLRTKIEVGIRPRNSERERERAQGPRRVGVIKGSDLGIRAKGE